MRPRSLVLLLALLGAGAKSAAAQAPQPEFNCADTVRKVLGKLTGVWEVAAIFRQGPDRWDTTSAITTIGPDLGGCVLREHYVGTRWQQPYRFLALWGANGDDTARIQRAFVHSQHGFLGVTSGSMSGDTLILRAEHLIRGDRVIEEHRFVPFGQPVFEQIGRRSTDGGVSWVTTLMARYRLRPRSR